MEQAVWFTMFGIYTDLDLANTMVWMLGFNTFYTFPTKVKAFLFDVLIQDVMNIEKYLSIKRVKRIICALPFTNK